MSQPTTTNAIGNKAEQVQSALAELLAAVSRRGFYGNATLSLSLQDGYIQHVKLATEKVMK